MTRFFSKGRAVSTGALLALSLFASRTTLAEDNSGEVYLMTNAAAGNSVLIFNRSANGALTNVGSVSTGGTGTGSGLGSQGALTLTADQRWLLAVNAGSNDITVFSVTGDGLQWRSKTASAGSMPISVAVHGRLVYVLNAGTPNVAGFTLRPDGSLASIAGAVQVLNGAAGPAQVDIDAEGDLLVVTDKPTNQIFTLRLNEDGVASAPVAHLSHGATPFGFAIDRRDHLVVSEAHGGPNNSSALSSYDVEESGDLRLTTGSAPTHQLAACWVVITANDKFAFTSNTASGTITGFQVQRNGGLAILNAQGVSANTGSGSTPTDLALSENSRFLFSLNPGAGNVAGWRIAEDGSLTFTGAATGVPASASGIAAR
jgi:6-phosphogluconolactonase (cycloisomerase 2 family)